MSIRKQYLKSYLTFEILRKEEVKNNGKDIDFQIMFLARISEVKRNA